MAEHKLITLIAKERLYSKSLDRHIKPGETFEIEREAALEIIKLGLADKAPTQKATSTQESE